MTAYLPNGCLKANNVDVLRSFSCVLPLAFSHAATAFSNAPINVKPQGGGGRPGVGGGFDVTCLPVAGTFDHWSSPGGRDF